jgi:hypothetical protein
MLLQQGTHRLRIFVLGRVHQPKIARGSEDCHPKQRHYPTAPFCDFRIHYLNFIKQLTLLALNS